jgi:hypothetical protein
MRLALRSSEESRPSAGDLAVLRRSPTTSSSASWRRSPGSPRCRSTAASSRRSRSTSTPSDSPRSARRRRGRRRTAARQRQSPRRRGRRARRSLPRPHPARGHHARPSSATSWSATPRGASSTSATSRGCPGARSSARSSRWSADARRSSWRSTREGDANLVSVARTVEAALPRMRPGPGLRGRRARRQLRVHRVVGGRGRVQHAGRRRAGDPGAAVLPARVDLDAGLAVAIRSRCWRRSCRCRPSTCR